MSPNRLIPLLAAALPLAAPAQIVINEIAAATSDRLVRYDETGAPHLSYDPQWHHPDFDDSNWPVGNAPIGSSGTNGTVVSREAVSLYARTSFLATASETSNSSPLVINVTYDDGFIAYLNGTEIARSNLGPVHAIAYHDQPAYNPNPVNTYSLTLPSASRWLVEGENVLAIQSHASGAPGVAITRIEASLTLQSPATPLVTERARWHYFQGTTEPSAGLYDRNLTSIDQPPVGDSNWKAVDFDDSRWETGSTPIGFDTGPDYTLNTNLAAEMRGKATSLYFRAAFDLTQAEIDSITSLTLPTDFDDGIAIFLNGFEAGRANLGSPGSATQFNATADSSHGARFDEGGNSPSAIVTLFPSRDNLKPGKNILAAQLHNNSIGSSDLFASLQLVAAGLGRNLVADGHQVSYFIGTATPTSHPPEPATPKTPKKPKVTDWIELHNPTPSTVSLEGWSLTDSERNLDAWVFPGVTMEPGAYLVVRASGRDETDPRRPLQTNFRLSATGEFLALVRPDGTIADDLGGSYPQQNHFHTYGRDASGALGYFQQATPGRANGEVLLATILPPPTADFPTGFYPDHIDVTLQTEATGATIRFTTDGTDPTEWNGIDYNAPVNSNGITDSGETEGEPGSVLREIWTNIPGTSVSQIPTNTPPDLHFNSNALSTPPNWIDNYGDRFRGYLRPPTTGTYSLWISSSHSSELWLSPTNSSADKQLVASVATITDSRQWDKFPSQHSTPIELEAGKSYYFESLRKSGTGPDHLAIAWDGPGIDRTVIFGNVIAPVVLPSTVTPGVKSLTLKARTFAPGHAPSPVLTRSYLIGYDPRFAQNHALLISGDPDRSLFNPNGATARVGGSGTWNPNDPTNDYNMAMEEGRPFERPIVFEYLQPGGTLGFRNGAAVRIAGSPHARPRYSYTNLETNNWLGSWTSKPSLNFFFRDELGNATVDYPLFGQDRVSRFSDFRLRAGKNDSANPFIKDEVMRRLSAATGQPASRGIFVNLFINGHYKAYFNLTERLRERFFQEHHNSSEGWDIWHIREIVEGDRTHYDETMNLLRSGNFSSAAAYASAAARIDLTSYIDYIIVNAYGATGDWPHNNYNLARERSPSGKWHFNVWDAEGAFGGFGHGINWNTLQQDLASGPTNHMTSLVYRSLRTNPEFRLLFADRIQKHFFDDGGLTQESIRNIYVETRDEFAPILRVARNQSINESFFNSWWPNRRNILFSHFQSQGMWPTTKAPNFSKLAGEVPAGTEIFMANLNADGTVHFTTDGTDPRAAGGAVAGRTYDGTPVTVSKSTLLKARVRLQNGQWSPLREILFTTPEPPSIVVSEIHYNPDGDDALEFVELKNTGSAAVDLQGLTFTNGIDFTFSQGALAPGALLVLVKDPDTFSASYPGVTISGTFTGSLDNAGERLTLSEPGGRSVFSVRYNDKAPWPTSADGDGFSLVLSNPGDPDSPGSWRPSTVPGGTPGTDPISTFAAWQQAFFSPGDHSDPLDDPDGDLIPNIIEYALALSPLTPDSSPLTISGTLVNYTTYDPATDVSVTLSSSTDLGIWQPVGPVTTTPNGDGTSSNTLPITGDGPVHFRLSVTLNP